MMEPSDDCDPLDPAPIGSSHAVAVPPPPSAPPPPSTPPTPPAPPFDSPEYARMMEPHRLNEHAYTAVPDEPPKMNEGLMKEWDTLNYELPITPEAAMFVMVNEADPNQLKVMMSGPRGTPYDSGLLFLSIDLPEEYPVKPPEVTVVGPQRPDINPHIYKTGRIALSLLNTWSDDGKGARWDPEQSTIYQVLLSIQSLVLVEHPYYLQWGKERLINTRTGETESREYNFDLLPKVIEEMMVDPITHPVGGFEQAIRDHFELKRDYLLKALLPAYAAAVPADQKVRIARLKRRLELAYEFLDTGVLAGELCSQPITNVRSYHGGLIEVEDLPPDYVSEGDISSQGYAGDSDYEYVDDDEHEETAEPDSDSDSGEYDPYGYSQLDSGIDNAYFDTGVDKLNFEEYATTQEMLSRARGGV